MIGALYIPYENPDKHRKCHRKYGEKIDYSLIPEKFLKKSETVEQIRTDIYQAQLLHKEFSHAHELVLAIAQDGEGATKDLTLLVSLLTKSWSNFMALINQRVDAKSLQNRPPQLWKNLRHLTQQIIAIRSAKSMNASTIPAFFVIIIYHST
ncbi:MULTISPECIES: hypothetical protein [Fischerella]|uniref:hypothetical protein n=1 Tax=Fischerella TaxID=1190 RepID=UPI0002F5F21E|nr:hypothetical protein [Fischerella muscicola]